MVARLKESFQPVLNSEHSAYQWLDIVKVGDSADLHPVVDLVFKQPHVRELAAAVNLESEAFAVGKKRPKKLGAGLLFVCVPILPYPLKFYSRACMHASWKP